MLKNRFWTKTGLTRLGVLIRECRESNQLPLRDAAQLIANKSEASISYRTLASVENASSEPKYNTLVAIARAGFVKKNGKVLDIWDFINIASESEPEMGLLSKLIYDYLNKNNLDFEGFSKICGVSMENLEAIASGNQTQDYEGDLILLSGYLDNPSTGEKFSNHPELMEYCFGKKISNIRLGLAAQ